MRSQCEDQPTQANPSEACSKVHRAYRARAHTKLGCFKKNSKNYETAKGRCRARQYRDGHNRQCAKCPRMQNEVVITGDKPVVGQWSIGNYGEVKRHSAQGEGSSCEEKPQ